MMNIIRADLYRIFRSKGFCIAMGLFLAVTIFLTAGGTFYVVTENVGQITVVADDGTPTVIDVDGDLMSVSYVTGMAAPFEMINEDNVFILLWFLLPIIVFIASSDFSAGTAKNVLANGTSRVKFYLSKLILACTFCILIVVLNIVLAIAVGTILRGFGGTFDMEFVGRVLRPFGAQLFMFLAVTCVGIFFVFATKRTAAVNGAYLAFCMLPVFIIFILSSIPNSNFIGLRDYEVVSNIQALANIDAMETRDVIRAFAIGGFYMLASTIGGILLFKRSEVN